MTLILRVIRNPISDGLISPYLSHSFSIPGTSQNLLAYSSTARHSCGNDNLRFHSVDPRGVILLHMYASMRAP